MIRRILPWTAGAVAASAAIGSVASADTSSRWYKDLSKPVIQPPSAVFPVVWTTLYTSIAISSAVTLDRADPDQARGYWRALVTNLMLNTSWSWVFFKAHRIGPAIGVAAALTASSVDLTRRTWRADRRAGSALLPYVAWCGFATVLTTAIWRRNR